jgi:putative redox protein
MGGELFLAVVGGCFMSNLLADIKAREAEIGDVRVEVVGVLADSRARFAGVELRVADERGIGSCSKGSSKSLTGGAS